MFPQAFTVNELAGFQSGITVIYLERITVLSYIYFTSIVLQIERLTIKITHQTIHGSHRKFYETSRLI